MAHNNTLIFAPTYNEQGTVGTLIDALLALPVRSDLLFVDDSSTDGTMSICVRLLRPSQGFML